MTPALRLALSLVLSLLMWLPTIPSALRVQDQPEMIALRYLLALVVARVCVGLAFRVIRGYAAAVLADDEDEAPESEPAEADDGQSPALGRRHDDVTADGDDPPNEQQLLDDALDEAQEAAVLTH